MPRPIPLRLLLKILGDNGFFFVSQKGAHAKFRKIGNPALTVIVPTHEKEIRHGTFKSILRQSKLKEKDFYKE